MPVKNGDGRTLTNIPLAEYTRESPAELARRARSGSAGDHRGLLKLYGLLGSEYCYRPVTGGLPYLDFAVAYAGETTPHVLHNYGAIRCLEKLLGLVEPEGFILINDYGQTQAGELGEFEHQRFSHATFVGINFPLLKGYFCRKENPETGSFPGPSPPTPAPSLLTPAWLEPGEDNGRIHSRLLGHRVGAGTVRCFQREFGKGACDWAQEPWNRARANLQHGRVEAALAAYYQALERQPANWILMNEIANFLTFTLRNPPAGLAMARAALGLNPACSAELWSTLGDAYFELGKLPEAQNAYRRALRVNPADVKGRYNLVWVLAQEGRCRAVLALIAQALALDETGEYFERLIKKQNEILARLEQRNRHKVFLLANRVSSKAGEQGEGGGRAMGNGKE